MEKKNLQSMFGIWTVLFMTFVIGVFSSCEKLEEDMDQRVRTSSTSNNRKVFSQNKEREIINATTERCSFEKVIQINGTNTVEKKSIILRRSVEGIPEYQKYVTGFDYTHQQDNQIVPGEAFDARTEDNWKIQGRHNAISAQLGNGISADDIITSYDAYSEAATYSDGEIEVAFDFLDWSFGEK